MTGPVRVYGKEGLIALALSLFLPIAAASQDRWPVSVEVDAGLRAGVTTGDYQSSLGLAASALIGIRAKSTARGTWVVATSFGGQSPGPSDDICIIGSDASCLPRFLEFTAITVMGGWEDKTAGRRVLTGPAVYRIGATTSNLRFAWHGRLDAFSRPIGRIALGVSAQTFLIPSAKGDAFLIASLGFGLRLR